MIMQMISAKSLFEKNRRFDLIYKIMYLENINSCSEKREYYKKLYCQSIKTFNSFKEDDKCTKEDFINSFEKNYNSIVQNGFNPEKAIPVNDDLQLYDGAHRLSIAYTLGLDVPIVNVDHNDIFDYVFFKNRSINNKLADIGALEYVKRNKNAHIVQVFPIVSSNLDSFIEATLNSYGFIYYKKRLHVSYSGLIRIKQINYGQEEWAGGLEEDYKGLKNHAFNCLGYGTLRVYVFVCEDNNKAIDAKKVIRDKIGNGNFPIHINDNHSEAMALANIYFNKNGLDWINSTPYNSYVCQIDNKAVVKIADQGPGVPEDEIDKIFTPFYCINPDRNPQKGGIGLGLSIALRAIKLHKGNIKMSNRPEGGLLATIDFPLESD